MYVEAATGTRYTVHVYGTYCTYTIISIACDRGSSYPEYCSILQWHKPLPAVPVLNTLQDWFKGIAVSYRTGMKPRS